MRKPSSTPTSASSRAACGALEYAVSHALSAGALAERAGANANAAAVAALAIRGFAESMLGHGVPDDALANARLALEHARQAGDPQVVAGCSCIAGIAEALLGNHEQARLLAAAALSGAEEMRDFWWMICGRALLGLAEADAVKAP